MNHSAALFDRSKERWLDARWYCSCMAGYYQIAHDRDFLARETKVFEDDGVKRAQRNPRLNSLAREIPRGNIYDRNGVSAGYQRLERVGAPQGRLRKARAYRSTPIARGSTTATILLARSPRIFWVICVPGKISMRPTHR